MIDRNTVRDIYDRHARELMVFIRGFVRIQETAEDILHDAFVRMMRYSEHHPLDTGNIRSFLYRTARNLCIDHARRSRRIGFSPITGDLESGHREPQEEIEYGELRRKVEELLDRTDPVARSVYLMRTELEMPYRDIAETLRISERTAKRKMSGILEYLAESLEKSGFLLVMIPFLALMALRIVLY